MLFMKKKNTRCTMEVNFFSFQCFSNILLAICSKRWIWHHISWNTLIKSETSIVDWMLFENNLFTPLESTINYFFSFLIYFGTTMIPSLSREVADISEDNWLLYYIMWDRSWKVTAKAEGSLYFWMTGRPLFLFGSYWIGNWEYNFQST